MSSLGGGGRGCPALAGASAAAGTVLVDTDSGEAVAQAFTVSPGGDRGMRS
jgi:hypothetical protein